MENIKRFCPIGVTPKEYVSIDTDRQKRDRFWEIYHAIERYNKEGFTFPMDWLEQLVEITALIDWRDDEI